VADLGEPALTLGDDDQPRLATTVERNRPGRMGAHPDEERTFELHGAEDGVEGMHGDLGRWIINRILQAMDDPVKLRHILPTIWR
jgi:hypothetical protein